jgi:hypothetical protein
MKIFNSTSMYRERTGIQLDYKTYNHYLKVAEQAQLRLMQLERNQEQMKLKAQVAEMIAQLPQGTCTPPGILRAVEFFRKQNDLEPWTALMGKTHLLNVILGSSSQYTAGRGDHACGPISAFAAMELLQGTLNSSEAIDRTIKEGSEAYPKVRSAHQRALEKIGLLDGSDADLGIDAIFGKDSPITSKLVERGLQLGTQECVTLQADKPASATYCELLSPLMKSPDGCLQVGIVTLAPETMVIGHDPTRQLWFYFNSHGNDSMLSGIDKGPGILATYASLEALTQYLAIKKFWIDPSEATNRQINDCALYLLSRPRFTG